MTELVFKFKIGDRVRKVNGYQFPGEVRAAFTTINGVIRYVVQCTVPEVYGMLHIYNEEQLDYEKLEEERT